MALEKCFEQIPGLRKVVFNSKELLQSGDAYWKQQLALMPKPELLQEFWAKMADFYNTMTASKELFASIKCPVLVMAGELDRNASLSTVINAYHMIPKSQLCIIPNTGHVFFFGKLCGSLGKHCSVFEELNFNEWIPKLPACISGILLSLSLKTQLSNSKKEIL